MNFSITDAVITRRNNPVIGYESRWRTPDRDDQEGKWKRNAVKIVEAVPFIGGIPMGSIHCIEGFKIYKTASDKEGRVKGIGFMVRGGIAIGGLGVVYLVADFVKTLFDHTLLPLTKWLCRLKKKHDEGEDLELGAGIKNKFTSWVDTFKNDAFREKHPWLEFLVESIMLFNSTRDF